MHPFHNLHVVVTQSRIELRLHNATFLHQRDGFGDGESTVLAYNVIDTHGY